MMVMLQTLLSPQVTGQITVSETSVLNFVFKMLFILSVLFYIVFTFIVIRQVQIMKNTLITPVSPLLMLIAIVHFISAIFILGLFFVIL